MLLTRTADYGGLLGNSKRPHLTFHPYEALCMISYANCSSFEVLNRLPKLEHYLLHQSGAQPSLRRAFGPFQRLLASPPPDPSPWEPPPRPRLLRSVPHHPDKRPSKNSEHSLIGLRETESTGSASSIDLDLGWPVMVGVRCAVLRCGDS